MSIVNISRADTVDAWRIQTNLSAGALNNLEVGDYTKSNGHLYVTNSSSVVITATGTPLQVANNALIQKNLTVGQDLYVGTSGTEIGNTQIAGILSVQGKNYALNVSNSAIVNVNLQVTQTITTNNIIANSHVTIGGNETISGVLRLNGSGNVLYVNTGTTIVNTAVITDETVGNSTISSADITIADILGATVGTCDITNATIVTENVGNSTLGNASITYHTDTGTFRSYGVANVNSGLTVTGNTTTTNIVNSGLVHTNSLRVTGRSDIIGDLHNAGNATFDSNVDVTGNLGVSGNFVLSGDIIYDTDNLTLSANTPITAGYAYYNVNRYPNANASIRWDASNKQWQLRDVDNSVTLTSFSKILTSNIISDSVTSSSSSTIASSNTVNVVRTDSIIASRYANSAFIKANSSYDSQNTSGSYANSAFIKANSSYVSQNTTGMYANTSFGHANSSYVQANTATTNAATAQSHANAGYNQANTAITNAATADQRAVTSGSYANSAYTLANTKFASAGGTISGDVNVTGNLTVSGLTTYVNSTTLNIGDNVITLNADILQNASPTENAGIEIDRGIDANVSIRWNESSDNWEYTNDGTIYHTMASSTGTYANSAYNQANTALTNASTAQIHANAGYNQANTATTNAATADQKGVSAGSYANSAFSKANTATTNAQSAYDFAATKLSLSGGTITGSIFPGTDDLYVLGDSTHRFQTMYAITFNGIATSARYADLAEKYTTKENYITGTVIVVNTEDGAEGIMSDSVSQIVLGVVSEKPAYLMNSELEGQALALRGRVPVRVIGPVRKGDTLVSAPNGLATVGSLNRFGISLETNKLDEEKLVEVVMM